MPQAHLAGVFPHQRQVLQVAGLAVAVPEAAEDAQHLDVALQAHQVEGALEGFCIGHGDAGGGDFFAVLGGPAFNAFVGPFDVAVAQQRNQVVGDRPAHGVLEIDDARRMFVGDQQVARVVVAVHEHLRLRLRAGNQRAEGGFNDVPLFALGRETQVPLEEPFRHQLHLGDQARFVVFGQAAGVGVLLHGQQRVHGVAVEAVDIGAVELGQQGAVAQVFHQHETTLRVGGLDVGHVQAGARQALGNLQPRPDVFLVRRRIHHDPRPPRRLRAPVAAETRVIRRPHQQRLRIRQRLAGPLQPQFSPVRQVHAFSRCWRRKGMVMRRWAARLARSSWSSRRVRLARSRSTRRSR